MKKILFGISALATVSCLFTIACQNPPAPTEKAKLDVTCTGCTIEEQKEFLHIYTLNYDVTLTVVADQDFILPDDVDAKIGDKQLVKDTDYTYSKDSGELKFTIKGDTTITITAQSEKPKLDVTCIDCTINGQKEIHNLYTLNDDVALIVAADPNYVLPDDVDAKIGDKQLVKDTDYTYSKDSGELKFTIKGDTTITITAQTEPQPKDLNDCTWAEIKEISDSGTASELFKVGDTKDIVVNGQTHQVRIIGFDQDYTDPNDKEGTKIGITFEFVNILSDENGYSLAAYWNDTEDTWDNTHEYWNSTIRAVLNGEGTADKNWFQYFGTDHDGDTNKAFSTDYSGKSVLNDMLPDDLKAVLTAPIKYVRMQTITNGKWTEIPVDDKLFLLSPREMGCEETRQESSEYTFTYSYYEDLESDDDMIKHQVNSTGARTSFLMALDLQGKHTGEEYEYKVSAAGFEDNSDPEGHDFGGTYWLRSPETDGDFGSCAWGVNEYGYFGGNEACLCASGLAPAFCV